MNNPQWKPMGTAPKDNKRILVVWEFLHNTDTEFNTKQVGIARFNGKFWCGFEHNGRVTLKFGSYKPIAWMELPQIDFEEV